MSESRFWRSVGLVFLFVVSVAFLFEVWNIVIPFLIGLAIAYLFFPMVDRFVAMGIRQDRVVLVLYACLLGAGALLIFFLLPNLIHQAKGFANDLPSYAKTLDQAVAQLNDVIRQAMERTVGRRARVFEIPFHAEIFLDRVIAALPSKFLNVAQWGLWVLIVPFVSFFGLSQGHKWIDMIFQLTPSEYVESLLGLLAEINATLGGYLRGLVLESLCVGVLTTLGLAALGVDGFVFLGVLTAFLNIVPFLAPVVGGAIAILMAIFQGAASSTLLGILILFLCVRLFDDFVLIPFVIGHSVQLHPLLMLFAILAGFEIGGIMGLLVAVPGTAILKVIATVLMRTREERMAFRLHQVHI